MKSTRNRVRMSLIALLWLAFSGAPGVLRAQETPVAPPADQPSVQQAGGPGRQLAHGSREGAGQEKDETAEFKESASVQLIAKWTGMSLQHAYWLSVVLNFVVIAAALAWAGKKFLPGMFRDRTASIQKAMQEAQKASEEARRRLTP